MMAEKFWVEITYCDYETQEDLQTLGESEMFDNEQDALDRFKQDINLIALGGEFGGVWMGDIAVHVNIMCDEETINPNGTVISWYGMEDLDEYYNNGRK